MCEKKEFGLTWCIYPDDIKDLSDEDLVVFKTELIMVYDDVETLSKLVDYQLKQRGIEVK